VLSQEELLRGTENRACMARMIDHANQALKTWEVVVTDFLSPLEGVEAKQLFTPLSEVHLLAWGGYPQAERQRLAIARPELPLDPQQVPLAAISIAGNFLFDTATHRDFLGALLGTGIMREKVGDILVLGDRGAQGIVVPELVDFLQVHLTQVRTVPVKVRPLDWTELKVREPRQKQLTTVEASLRLDAIASAGFSMSRSKMASLISSGDVRVNWKPVTQPSYLVKSTDLIAIRGKGRILIGEIGVTKKERYRVQLTRFL